MKFVYNHILLIVISRKWWALSFATSACYIKYSISIPVWLDGCLGGWSDSDNKAISFSTKFGLTWTELGTISTKNI